MWSWQAQGQMQCCCSKRSCWQRLRSAISWPGRGVAIVHPHVVFGEAMTCTLYVLEQVPLLTEAA